MNCITCHTKLSPTDELYYGNQCNDCIGKEQTDFENYTAAEQEINKWCDLAHETGQKEHKKHFWVIRDIIEHTGVKENLVLAAIDFVEKKCRNTESKTIILEAVYAIRRKMSDCQKNVS